MKWGLFLGSLVCVCVLGCGGGSSAIKTDMVVGTVTLEGAPLAGATLNFTPATSGEGSPAYATTDEKGQYKLQTLLGAADAGTTPGTYVVTITKAELIPTGKKELSPEGEMVDIMTSKSLLPATYTDMKTSPFKSTVVKGKNTFDFELKSKP